MAQSDDKRNPEWYAQGLRFTCTQCGNCCTGPSGYVWFDEEELEKMAEHVGVTREEFLERYAKKVHGRWSLEEVKTKHGYDCIFLRRDPDGKARCSIYSARPTQCRTWPFWPENLSSPRAWRRAAKGCPGIAKAINGDEGDFFPVEDIRIRRDMTP